MSHISAVICKTSDRYTQGQIDNLIRALQIGYGDDNVTVIEYGQQVAIAFEGYGHEGEIILKRKPEEGEN